MGNYPTILRQKNRGASDNHGSQATGNSQYDLNTRARVYKEKETSKEKEKTGRFKAFKGANNIIYHHKGENATEGK